MAENTLFIGIQIEQPEGIGDNDYVVVLIDPNPDDRHTPKLRITAGGRVDDHLRKEKTATVASAYRSAAKRSDRTWSVELAISLKALGTEPGTSRIGFNLGWASSQGPIESLAFWQPLAEHNADSFGALIIEGDPP